MNKKFSNDFHEIMKKHDNDNVWCPRDWTPVASGIDQLLINGGNEVQNSSSVGQRSEIIVTNWMILFCVVLSPSIDLKVNSSTAVT